jgi:3-deoxy-D-manno-octulosonic-acid transferase
VNRALRLAYSTAGQLARLAAALAPGKTQPRGGKLVRALRARHGIRARYAAWAGLRDITRPLLWIHAPSVGEGLQARPLLELIRQRHPEIQLAFTFFSPSAEGFAHSLAVDFADYLPFDTPGDVGVALDALRPTALVFSKTDAWPVLMEQAASRGVKVGMISGTLSPVSSRQGALATRLLQASYALFDMVGAVSSEDAERLVRLGVRPEALVVTGDTRYDQVWERARVVDRTSPLLTPLRGRATLVAGSTWPSDDEVLLPAWVALLRDYPELRLVIAPHEPEPRVVGAIEHWSEQQRLRSARLAAGADALLRADVVVVDRVGVLGDLYAAASVAFVGGGFHDAGLHSVLEPAAFGLPVAFGPRHASSRDAQLLLKAGAARSVATVDETVEVLGQWFGDEAARASAGQAARALVEAGTGAAERTLELVLRLLGYPAPTSSGEPR